MSYTKGPWKIEWMDASMYTGEDVEGRIPVGLYSGKKKDNKFIWRESFDSINSEDIYLISAAPDMYESGKEMAEAVALLSADDGRIIGLLPILCRLRQALAKAEGRE